MGKPKKGNDVVTYVSLAEIEAAEDVKEADVATPEWGGYVRVRGMTKGQEMALRKRATVADEIDTERLEMLFLIDGMITPQANDSDIAMLKEKNGAVVNRILRQIMDLSGISEAVREKTERAFRERSAPEVPVPPSS